MAAQLLGAHMPAPGGIDKAVLNGHAIGCTAVQVFTSSPQQWRAAPVDPGKAQAFKKACEETGIHDVVSHDSYLISLSSANEEHRQKSINGLKNEMLRCATYGIGLVVSHIGAQKDRTEDDALKAAAEGILQILGETPDEVTLLAETTAGQGSVLNAKFEQLGSLIDRCGGHKRLGVCLDTCHVFVAGYDIRTQEAYDHTFAEFDRLVGLNRLKAIHCNDAKRPLGSRVDRHAHIGEGEIGLEGFRLLVNDPRFEHVPILLETPEAQEMHETNLKTLKSLIK